MNRSIVPATFPDGATVSMVPMTVMPVAAPPPSSDQIIKAAHEQIRIRKAYIKLIAHNIEPRDVLVFGNEKVEQIYLPKKICVDILSWAGADIHFDGPIQSNFYPTEGSDGFIEFTVMATITDRSGRKVQVMGNRSTRDEFFGIASKTWVCVACDKKTQWTGNWYGCPDHPGQPTKKKVLYKSLIDVDIASVRQAAISNLYNHAVESIGLKPTLKDLADSGMDITKVQKIAFGRGEDGGDRGEKQNNRQRSTTKKNASGAATSGSGNQTGGSQTPAAASTTGGGGSAPSGEPTKPEAASIPAGPYCVKGRFGSGLYSKTSRGGQFIKILLDDGRGPYQLFDNKEKSTGYQNVRLFDIFEKAKKGDQVVMWVKNRQTEKGTYMNVDNVIQIGQYEWEEDGTPVVRRDNPSQASFEEEPPFNS